jgi:hypothetical protein
MAISKEEIIEAVKKGKPIIVTKEELIEIYILFERPEGKCVKSYGKCFISFRNIEKGQFLLDEKIKDFEKVSFIDKIEKVDLDKSNQSFIVFFFLEFWQGNSTSKKIFYLFRTVLMLFVFNILIILFASEKNITNFFTGLLTAVSIFIAIFSVFTASHDQLNRKKPELFKSGKISYYFSVDKNLTLAGLVAIFTSLAGIIIVKDSAGNFILLSNVSCGFLVKILSRKGLILLLMNVSFLMTYITLRSLVEFYIHRPEMYIKGELKDDFLNKY